MEEFSVLRSSSGLVVRRSSDHQSQSCLKSIPTELVHRSKQLTIIYSAVDFCKQEELVVPCGSLNAWMEFVTASSMDHGAMPTSQLAATLQAADFLVDQAAMDATSSLLAARLLDGPEIIEQWGAHSSPPSEEYSPESIMNVLQHLADNTLLLIFRAAMSVSERGDVVARARAGGNEVARGRVVERDCVSFTSHALGSLLRRLQRKLWPLVLVAANASMDQDGELCLEDLDVYTADDVLMASAAVPRLTSVSLTCRPGSRGDFTNDLPHFPRLTCLKLSGGSDEDSSAWPSFGNLWVQLPKLRSLVVLAATEFCLHYRSHGFASFGHNEAMSREFPLFVDGVRHLTALEELVLDNNVIGNGGWELLAPAAAQLPLRVLSLRKCLVGVFADTPVLHCDGCDPARAFTSLECLRLGGDPSDYGPLATPEVHGCAALREFEHSGGGMKFGGDFLETLVGAPFRLEKFVFGFDVELRMEQQTEALCRCLARWTTLKHLDLLLYPDRCYVDAQQLAEHLESLTDLQQLRLRSDSRFDEFATALPRLKSLTGLHVWSYSYRYSGSQFHDCKLMLSTFQRLTALQELSINLDRGGVMQHVYFAESLAALTHLTHLHLKICELIRPAQDESRYASSCDLDRFRMLPLDSAEDRPPEDIYRAIYADCLRAHRELKVLRVVTSIPDFSPRVQSSHCELPCLVFVTFDMPWLSQLEQLSVNILSEDARALAQVLPQMASLRELDIASYTNQRRVTDEAADMIDAALPMSVVKYQWQCHWRRYYTGFFD